MADYGFRNYRLEDVNRRRDETRKFWDEVTESFINLKALVSMGAVSGVELHPEVMEAYKIEVDEKLRNLQREADEASAAW